MGFGVFHPCAFSEAWGLNTGTWDKNTLTGIFVLQESRNFAGELKEIVVCIGSLVRASQKGRKLPWSDKTHKAALSHKTSHG